MTASPDVVILGAGVIGSSIAWVAARAGFDVVVVDPDPGSGATHVAAGMLAPVSEAHWGEGAVLDLNLRSAAMWPSFAAALEAASGADIGFERTGTLLVAFDNDDLGALEDLSQLHADAGLQTERLTSRGCRGREPLLSPTIRAGALVPGDHHVDPRATRSALREAATALGARFIPGAADEVLRHPTGGVRGVLTTDGTTIHAASVVVACGAWSASIDGLPAAGTPPVRPVKGQLAVLRSPSPDLLPRTVVRGWVRGASIYLVPRTDGRVVVGASQEEMGFDTSVTAGAVGDLLRDAFELVPTLREHHVVELLAGLRPATPDHLPRIGPVEDAPGLFLATGHFRHGVLLAPLTAQLVLDALAPEASELPKPPTGVDGAPEGALAWT